MFLSVIELCIMHNQRIVTEIVDDKSVDPFIRNAKLNKESVYTYMNNITQTKIYGWDGYQIRAGAISMGIVPDIGGRIISLSYDGEEIFFVQKEFAGEVFDFSQVTALRAEKTKLGFRVWGGDKTWLAPQKDWWGGTPPLELDAGRYQTTLADNKISMVSPICRETGLQITRTVSMNQNGVISLGQEICNKGKAVVHKGIWNVTQLCRPFDVFLPTTKDKLRSYHEEDLTLPSHHIVVREVDGWSCVPCHDNQLFKFGGMVNMGAVLCLQKNKNGLLAYLKVFDVELDADYLHRSVVEVFNAMDHNYLEVETHASTVHLKPDQSSRHNQVWRLKQFSKSMTPQQIFDDMTTAVPQV